MPSGITEHVHGQATGAHYPADVLAGVLVGLAAARLLTRLGGKFIERPVAWVERLTDPVLARLGNGPSRAVGTR